MQDDENRELCRLMPAHHSVLRQIDLSTAEITITDTAGKGGEHRVILGLSAPSIPALIMIHLRSALVQPFGPANWSEGAIVFESPQT
jgi:hypothetical protein